MKPEDFELIIKSDCLSCYFNGDGMKTTNNCLLEDEGKLNKYLPRCDDIIFMPIQNTPLDQAKQIVKDELKKCNELTYDKDDGLHVVNTANILLLESILTKLEEIK